MKIINPKVIRQIFVLLLIILTGGLIFKEIIPYFSGVLGAITLYVLLHKPMTKLIKKGWRPKVASALLMLISFLVILIPVSGALFMLGSKIGNAVDNSERVTKAFKTQLQQTEKYLGYDLTSEIDVSAVSGWVSKNLQGLVGGTFTTIIAISIMYFLLFYMLTNRKSFGESLYDYIPISTKNLNLIGDETRAMVRANALGIPLVAIAQGIVALIGFLIFGIDNPFFWAVIVTIGSMVPFIGNFLGTIPVFILALSNGDTFQAWGILLYGIVVVGSTDNIIRLYVLQKLDNVHPLVTLIGVIIGIPLFGFIGLIFGPLLISLFLIIVKIYRREYSTEIKDQL
ncbi:AI-2E family transporter [Maribacter hydrothermalis]|uniref:AI-2E family transporter n=1 Tax=Maribacter hydrothermalis TaxID=1836467 RepID=A0A1B7Z1U5_9FLAO|nr:AI-2E family transporter [Maribacter hydrothermalis]APQ18173.1 AI-2E family transporter [Maribacter hydrothermalis]OBR36520.1 AI-2E family transporter [Maribacter hydrothermalis]